MMRECIAVLRGFGRNVYHPTSDEYSQHGNGNSVRENGQHDINSLTRG